MTKEEFEVILNNLTDARDTLNRLQLERETARSELYLSIKCNPGSYGLEKVTENTIEALINTSSNIVKLEEKIIDAKHRQGECFAKYDLAKYEIDLMKNEQIHEKEQ